MSAWSAAATAATEDTGAGYGRLTISSPTSPCEYTLDLRAYGISLRVAHVDV